MDGIGRKLFEENVNGLTGDASIPVFSVSLGISALL
jgi:hypothetical protein